MIFAADFSPNPSKSVISSWCLDKRKISPYFVIHPSLMNLASVCSEIPSISIPAFDTKRLNFFSFLAGQLGFVHLSVSVPRSLISTIVLLWHTGQVSGIWKLPTACFTLMTFGMILFALMTSSSLPASPIPKRLHSLILQREARFTVVPSISTGSNTATGVIVDAAQDHSIYSSLESTDSSCHLNAKPALVA